MVENSLVNLNVSWGKLNTTSLTQQKRRKSKKGKKKERQEAKMCGTSQRILYKLFLFLCFCLSLKSITNWLHSSYRKIERYKECLKGRTKHMKQELTKRPRLNHHILFYKDCYLTSLLSLYCCLVLQTAVIVILLFIARCLRDRPTSTTLLMLWWKEAKEASATNTFPFLLLWAFKAADCSLNGNRCVVYFVLVCFFLHFLFWNSL